ncbi:hypothetical protein [Streptomyces sp. NBC_00557]|uniref:hypothetical protein n=1 Tax=Streptomyces sp. NBC_00557 TaxID=2975776 RepID=UPI002E814E23|nr:hypothetical protein [Streptomyces sp. NBC_00557]WUC34775.1 hypothetical protein OG956_11400 [Streptomyces sp. NBC_00557]
MSTRAFHRGSHAASATGALLLCRAQPDSVGLLVPLLRERMALTRAGERWSLLVPEGSPWRADGAGSEPVDRVLTGWASALAVGSSWPVLALWWDADRVGYTLASGFRRPVEYVWLANGTPAGEHEAMHTFAARLGLDPVRDVQALDALTAPASDADGPARLRGLIAVLAHAGVELPAGLSPGESADRLLHAVTEAPGGVLWVQGADRGETAGTESEPAAGQKDGDDARREAVRAEPEQTAGERDGGTWQAAVRLRPVAGERDGGGTGIGAWVPGSGDPRARWLGMVQAGLGLPVTLWGIRRRSGGWVAAGLLLLAHGVLAMAYEGTRGRV